MIENFFSIGLLCIISAIPIILWGYIFSYIDSHKLSHKRFIIGIVGGMIAVIPILFLEKMTSIQGLEILNIFSAINSIKSFSELIYFYGSITLFTLILAGVAFVCISWTLRSRELLKTYLRNILLFLFVTALLTIFVGIFSFLDLGSQKIMDAQSFGGVVFDTFLLVSFYYLLVAFIEETSKHFNFLQSTREINITVDRGVLYAIFIALGFAFVENILYLYYIYASSGLSTELASTFFYRSVFTIMVHITCSSVVAYSYTRLFLQESHIKKSFMSYGVFIGGLFLGILLHLIFDLSLTLGFSFMIIIYFLGGYFYVSSIFYKE